MSGRSVGQNSNNSSFDEIRLSESDVEKEYEAEDYLLSDEDSGEQGNAASLKALQNEATELKKAYLTERDIETIEEDIALLDDYFKSLSQPNSSTNKLGELYAYRIRLIKRLSDITRHNGKNRSLNKIQKENEAEFKQFQKLEQIAAKNAELASQEGGSLSPPNSPFLGICDNKKTFTSRRFTYLKYQLNPFKADEIEVIDHKPQTVEARIRAFVRKSLRFIGSTFNVTFSVGSKVAQAVDDVPSAMQAGLLSEALAATLGKYLLSGAGIVIFGIEAVRSSIKLIKTGFKITKTLLDSELSYKERFAKAKDHLLDVTLPTASFFVCLGGLAVSAMLLATVFGASLYFAEFLPFFVTVGVAALATKEFIESIKNFRFAKKKVEEKLKPTPDGKYSALEAAKNDYIKSLKLFNQKAGSILDDIKALERRKAALRKQINSNYAANEALLTKEIILTSINSLSGEQAELDKKFAALENDLARKKHKFEKLARKRKRFINAKAELGFSSIQLALSLSICLFAFVSTAAFIGVTATSTLGIIPGALIISLAGVGLGIKIFQEVVKLQGDRKDYTYLEAAKDLFYTYPKKAVLGVSNWFKRIVAPAPAPAPAPSPGGSPKPEKRFGTYSRIKDNLPTITMEPYEVCEENSDFEDKAIDKDKGKDKVNLNEPNIFARGDNKPHPSIRLN